MMIDSYQQIIDLFEQYKNTVKYHPDYLFRGQAKLGVGA